MAKKINPYSNFVEDDELKIIYFYGSVFSNWAKTPFRMMTLFGETEFPTSEHAFMWNKALFFGDKETADKMLKVQDPCQVKQWGRQVKGYVDSEWDKVRYSLMKEVCLAKFSGNKTAYREMVRYKNYSFAEASPVDCIWGIGLGCDDPRIFNEPEWLGQNLLGKVLNEVRGRTETNNAKRKGFTLMSNLMTKAQREFDILRAKNDPENSFLVLEFEKEILSLVDAFGNSGQSGGSAPYTAGAIVNCLKQLMAHETISPLTGDDDEWFALSDMYEVPTRQNNRNSAVFQAIGSRPHYLNAIVWQGEEKYDSFTGKVWAPGLGREIGSFCEFDFPFTPKTFYIDVVKEKLPEGYQGRCYEDEYYSQTEFEATGVKNWVKEKYRYVVKDESQLQQVTDYGYTLRLSGEKK